MRNTGRDGHLMLGPSGCRGVWVLLLRPFLGDYRIPAPTAPIQNPGLHADLDL